MDSLSHFKVTYRGLRFQSVLAARWAAFFDILGVEYLHEPQTFKVRSTVYSPSFFLPKLGDDRDDHDTLIPPGVFLDVQFLPPSEEELQTTLAISNVTNRNVCIFHGASMTIGLEWWPTVLETPVPCFFSQCPFCGRYGISSTSLEDGQREGTGQVHSHACMEEHKIPERYDVLSYCSQDLLISPHSPALDVAYDAARSLQFTEGSSALELAVSRRAVQAVMNTKTYCSPDISEWIIANAKEWAKGRTDSMRFDGAPWWVQHKKDLVNGVTPCTCYSCASRQKSEQRKLAAKSPPTTLIQ